MKKLINIRGAVASGKTTAVRQFCERRGFVVETISLSNAEVPVSVVGAGEIVVLGNYASKSNCTGVDSYRYKNGKSCTKDLIMRTIASVCKKYNPEVIVFERLLTSQTCKGTQEIADFARGIGYEYLGIQLEISEARRFDLLKMRSGAKAGTRSFHTQRHRVTRSAEMLRESGYRVDIVNVERIPIDEMWGIVENAVKAAV